MPTHSSDAIVIGAGIIGGSIAWRLAQAGAAVTLLDAGALGGEASWAGAGMLAPGGEFVTRGRWARFALESLALYPAFVAELRAEAGVEIDYRRCGTLEVARSETEWQDLRARLPVQEALGIRLETQAGGVFYPDDALVNPRETTRALGRACRARGVDLRERTRVLEVRVGAAGVEVETAGGVLAGRAAVLAAGAWSGGIPVLGPGGRRLEIPRSFPVRGHVLGYTLEPGSLGPMLRRGHTYVMQRSNGYTIAGTSSEEVGFNREMDPAIVAGIRERVCELLPALRQAPPPEAWLGFRPAAPDYDPVIGRREDTRLWLAYGHFRNGILLAPATAARVAGEITSSLGKD